MAQQRPKQKVHSATHTTVLTRRKLNSRRGPLSRRRVFTLPHNYPHSRVSVASSASPVSPRAVLVPLQFNLRRLPSRTFSYSVPREEMHDVVHVGSKRKRVPSGNENTQATRLQTKRRREALDSSDEGSSDMEVDERSYWELSDNSDNDGAMDSCKSPCCLWLNRDDVLLYIAINFLVNEAPPKQLLRLRKDELVRLYTLAGLTEDPELLTKQEIIDCLVAARDDLASLPPSSPAGPTSSASSDYSSDGGNVAGGEETDFGLRKTGALQRRVTVHDLGRTSERAGQERCFSLGEIDRRENLIKKTSSATLKSSTQPTARRYSIVNYFLITPKLMCHRRGLSNASSIRSSPPSSSLASMLPSPPATRLRTRKTSSEYPQPGPSSSTSSKGKGKAKQVEFSDNIQVESIYPDLELESDLTDLTEIEETIMPVTPSPRRLRSKGDKRRSSSQQSQSGDEGSTLLDLGRRVTPKRKAKGKILTLKEDSTEDEEDELEASDADERPDDQPDTSMSPTPKAASRARRTPMKKRLRSRRSQMLTPPSDGDDEGSDDQSVDIEQSVDGNSEEEEEEEADDATVREGSEVGEEDENPLSQPRTLRNGKVVGDDPFEDDLPELTEEEEDSSQEQQEDAASVDLDAEGDTDEEEEDVDSREPSEDPDEVMEDDGMFHFVSCSRMRIQLKMFSVDLTVATTKTLIRLRRDDLIRLCESRDLDPIGTKPQLAEALLQWRDKHSSDITSSPSSVHTTRPPSTARPRPRRRTRSKSTTPVLLRSERVHIDEPVTPPLTSHNKEAEPEFELDLESLGLDDREIPPDKLTKLEKIGSGGFKDVFIGKLKGRRVAIAEFRGQLSASMYPCMSLLILFVDTGLSSGYQRA